ncbi:MAG: enoyl-CoA hydratase/isomerase family protein [Desulfosalsimonadaceae bacterium]
MEKRVSPNFGWCQEKNGPQHSLEETLQHLTVFPYPTIAMLNGDAYGGGCELAISCDLHIAGDYVNMGMPPARLGLVYPYPGSRRFVNVLGFAATLEVFLTGRPYDSQPATTRDIRQGNILKNSVESNIDKSRRNQVRFFDPNIIG